MKMQKRENEIVRPMLVVFGLGSAGLPAAGQVIRYGPPEVYDELNVSNYMAAADLNDDGIPDVAAYAEDNKILLLHGDGHGGLIQAGEIPIGGGTDRLFTGDLEGDGDVDLVWKEGYPSNPDDVFVWLNSGDGISGSVVIVPTYDNVYVVEALGDLNDDGYLDIVTSEPNQGLGCLFGSASGEYEFRWLYERTDEYNVRTVSLGDFDQDGDLDALAPFQYIYEGERGGKDVEGTELVVLINDGDEQFSPTFMDDLQFASGFREVIYRSTVGDLDGDGDLDALIGAAGSWAYNSDEPMELIYLPSRSPGSFKQKSSVVFGLGLPRALTLADVNADGRLDVVVTASSVRGVYALENAGSDGLVMAPAFPSDVDLRFDSQLAVTDIDGNGMPDIITAGDDGMSVLINRTDAAGPRLGHEPLVRGSLVTIGVADAEPGDRVHFLYSLEGTGNSLGIAQLGGITLDLLNPIVKFASGTVGDTGRLDVLIHIPANAPLGPVALQAVIRRGPNGADSVKSPYKTAVIKD